MVHKQESFRYDFSYRVYAHVPDRWYISIRIPGWKKSYIYGPYTAHEVALKQLNGKCQALMLVFSSRYFTKKV